MDDYEKAIAVLNSSGEIETHSAVKEGEQLRVDLTQNGRRSILFLSRSDVTRIAAFYTE